MTDNETDEIEKLLGECIHTQETPHGTLDAVNPYSHECQICKRIVKKGLVND